MADYHFYETLTPVGRELNARVVANGPLKAKHLRNLIRMLEIDIEFLEEDEAERIPQMPVPLEERPAL